MNVKIIQKYKDKSVSKLLGLATSHFNAFIRFRDSTPIGNGERFGACISCGRRLIVPSDQAQAGHYYEAIKYPSLRYDENNVHLQCKKCNYFLSANLLPYKKNLTEKIGVKKVQRLDDIVGMTRGRNQKWDRILLIEIIEKYKEKKKQFK